jgi:hypothetical protein
MNVSQNGECSLWVYVELHRIGFSTATLCNCARLMIIKILTYGHFTDTNLSNEIFEQHQQLNSTNSRVHFPVLFVVSVHY